MLLETNLIKRCLRGVKTGRSYQGTRRPRKRLESPSCARAQRLLSPLQAENPFIPKFNFEPLILLLGQFFQIRDDYMNLQSTEYGNQKGLCEDLDEGKYSYPIVHLLAHKPEYETQITGIFQQRPFGFDHSSCLAGS
jgi:hypothetical protein